MSHKDASRLADYLEHIVLAHGYFKVDMSVVWRTLELDLPQFDGQIQALLLLMAKKIQ